MKGYSVLAICLAIGIVVALLFPSTTRWVAVAAMVIGLLYFIIECHSYRSLMKSIKSLRMMKKSEDGVLYTGITKNGHIVAVNSNKVDDIDPGSLILPDAWVRLLQEHPDTYERSVQVYCRECGYCIQFGSHKNIGVGKFCSCSTTRKDFFHEQEEC